METPYKHSYELDLSLQHGGLQHNALVAVLVECPNIVIIMKNRGISKSHSNKAKYILNNNNTINVYLAIISWFLWQPAHTFRRHRALSVASSRIWSCSGSILDVRISKICWVCSRNWIKQEHICTVSSSGIFSLQVQINIKQMTIKYIC